MMKIVSGLMDSQVLQRDAKNAAAIRIAGECKKDGKVFARIVKGSQSLRGFNWTAVGSAAKGKFSAALKSIPMGGPYKIELQIRDAKGAKLESCVAKNILVGDLWLMVGQSNMQGVGDMINEETPMPGVNLFGMSRKWSLAKDPLHRLFESPDAIHWCGVTEDKLEEAREADNKSGKGAGLGLPFGKELYKATGVPVGLVACGHGGTSLEQWDPALKSQGGDSLYGSTALSVKEVGGKVAGIIWYQGESDAGQPASLVYLEKFKNLVANMRKDFGTAKTPFIAVQIGRLVWNMFSQVDWNRIQEAQRLAAEQVPYSAVSATVDLALDDGIHISTPGLQLLGARMAKQARMLRFSDKSIEHGPLFQSAEVRGANKDQVYVTFKGVNGRLRPYRRIAGFSIFNAKGEFVPMIFDAQVDPEKTSSVMLKLSLPVEEGMRLWYGFGTDPYCNLMDSEGFGALVFGPQELKVK